MTQLAVARHETIDETVRRAIRGSVATTRTVERIGNVGPVTLGEIRETLGLLLDL